MFEIAADDIQEILIYSDIYDTPMPILEDELRKLDIGKAISIICELIAVRNVKISINNELVSRFFKSVSIPYQLVIKKDFCGITSDEKLLQIMEVNKHVISLQTLLILLKLLVKESDKTIVENTDFKITKQEYENIIKLNLLVAEKLSEHDAKESFSPSNFVYGTYHINNDHNVASEIVRSFYIMSVLGRNNDLLDQNIIGEYRDYWNAFYKEKGYTIDEYMYVLFRLLEMYIGRKAGLSHQSTWFNPKMCYKSTSLDDIACKVISNLSCTISDLKEWSTTSAEEFWNFKKFLETPFISDEKGQYMVISDYTLKNCFFEKLYWEIRSCYPEEDSRAMSFYGRLYEKYIQDQIADVLKNNHEYKYIPEFKYGKHGANRSSDAYIRQGNKLLAIEAKGFPALFDCLQNRSVENNLEKLFIKPVLQADKAFFNNRENAEFSTITDLYIFSVSMDSINAVPEYINTCVETVNNKKKAAVLKGFFNISIEELEMFLFMIESGEDVFALTEKYLNNKALMPFSNFMEQESKVEIKMTSFMKRQYDAFVDKMRKAYWPA